ncbi:MAG: TetR family transcriptional regulator [Solirubrobacterales bacterium]|nr:TetR family transcriptional regulator [Solirubrobacterales bacterium]
MAQDAPGLRERKKRQTREAIVREALRLFAERGFDATTVADIAEAADIAPRTFFGYFPSKEAVVFHDFEEYFGSLATRLAARPASQTAFDTLRAWIAALLDEGRLDDPEERMRHELVHTTPALQAQDRANLARFEALLADAVADDLDVPRGSLRAHLVAAAAAAALDALGRHDGAREQRSPDESLALMDEALVFLQGGMDALRRHPPA